ncbi:DUF1801 domain-containing protein [Nonomuraea africana]|uniref:YdhG-like domain-containing protein n=1 Tax=Nonomuraea africana TaxID=46171 RepID=A0ABR9KCD4_9ACTN|nr:DUF1801 domain-containing protein [Nonomuraea africana]MBE1559669.1 hypothetical protein [Nonomuraea africana]
MVETEAAGHGPDVEEWLDSLDGRARGQVEELSAMVGRADHRLEQSIKWGRLTFTVEGNWHHWLCGIAVTKKGVKLVFHKGALLADQGRILAGSGRYLREMPAETAVRQAGAVAELVREAIAHQTDLPE